MALCESCSAPMPPNKNICNYCGQRSDVDLKGIHQYTVNKPRTERICPNCGIPLQTLDLGLEGNFYIERCEQCLGMFFDPGELETVLEKSVSNVFHVNIDKIKNLSNELVKENFRVAYRKCPICRKLMHRINFGTGSGVIIDNCKPDGIWLEGSELRRLMEWKKAGGQILDEQRKKMAEAEKLSREKQRAKEHSSSLETMGSAYNSPHSNDYHIIGSVLKLVSRLF